MATVPVYTWRFDDGAWYGQGTQAEFDHWRSQGIIPDDVKTAELLGYELASDDDRRKKVWASA